MKKGISLIVLVITIIVIIILAGAVILSLAQNNPIGQANQATREHDAGEIESALSMYLGTIMGKYRDQVKLDVEGKTDMNTNIAVVSSNDVPLFENSKGEIAAFADQTAADASGDTTYVPVLVTYQKLGLASWPTHPGYTLEVDQYANVTYTAITTP